MSAVVRVWEAIKENGGSATVAQIAPHLPDLTGRQLLQALANAKEAGRVKVKVKGNFRGKRATVWEALAFTPKRRSPPKPRLKPAASVFDMADREPITGAWPPPFEMARKFNLLGDWN